MTTDVSPVTETEMRNFFDRFATTFVGLSHQAEELKALQGEVANLRHDMQVNTDRINGLMQENENLRNQVQTLVAERDKARQDALDNHNLSVQYSRDLDETRAHRDGVLKLNETLTEAINDLRGQVTKWSNEHWQVSNTLRQSEAAQASSARELEYWQGKANTAEARLAKVKAAFEDAQEAAKEAVGF